MKRLLSIALTCLFLFGLAPISLIAHEMYPNLRWHNAPYSASYGHSVLQMKVNGDFLNSTYSGYVSDSIDKWNDHSDDYVSMQQTSISNSDVDLANYGFAWPIDWGNNAGYTLVYDSNGNEYKSGNFSGTKIYYSQIYTNPAYDQGVTDYGLQVNLLVHELGHTMNLGHPTSSSTASVMRTPVDFYDTPQDHDRNDLANYY